MKNTGIWMDKNKALIITLENGEESLKTITSNVEHFKPSGGSGTRFKGGPQDVVQDNKYLEREKNQLKTYFKEVASEVNDSEALVIFGPAGTSGKFRKEIDSKYKSLSNKIVGVEKADSMSENQTKAWVRDFFESNKTK